MCANILANSLDVELQGELPADTAAATLEWLQSVKRSRRLPDPQRDYVLARDVFRNAAKARPMDRPGARWFGHKSPHHEKHFDACEAIFDDPVRRAVYVYCLRSPLAVWRSHRAMPWSGFRDVDAFLKSWTRSVERYDAMRAAAPDRVLLFNLDGMLAAPDRFAWLEDALFRPLGLATTSFRRPPETLDNSNSSIAKLGSPPQALPSRDQSRIVRDRRVRAIEARFFAIPSRDSSGDDGGVLG